MVLAGCGGPARAPEEGSAVDLSGARPLPEIQRLRAVALVDGRYRRIPNYDQRVGDRLDAVSDHLAARFGLPLDLLSVRPWTPPRETGEVEALLAEIEEADAAKPGGLAPEADLVIVFTAQPPPRRPKMQNLVRSRYAERFIVARSLTSLFPPEAVAALHQAEVVALLHGIGRVFGATPTCEGTIMADEPAFLGQPPPLDLGRWLPLNLALVRAHATLDLRHAGRGSKIPGDIAARALELLASAPPAVERCAGPRLTEREALLRSVTKHRPAPEKPAPEANEAARRRVPGGLAALAAGDAARAFAACEPAAAMEPASDAARCAGLAADRLGRSRDAARYLRAWLAHHPGDEDVVLALARVIGRDGDDRAARALLEGFVSAHPKNVRARVNLGVASARLGDLDAARAQWEAVLRRDPGNADARELLDQLRPGLSGAGAP